MHQQKSQHSSILVGLLVNTVIVGMLGFVFLFMLPDFLNFTDEIISLGVIPDLQESLLSNGEK